MALQPLFVRLVPAIDPLLVVAIPAVFAVTAVAACYIPARRAAGVEPSVALRDL